MTDTTSFAFRYGQAAGARDTQAADNVIALRGNDPDAAAEANRLSTVTGIPGDTVERNLGDVRSMFNAKANASLVASNPFLTRWFADPRNAAAAHDDTPALHGLSLTLAPNGGPGSSTDPAGPSAGWSLGGQPGFIRDMVGALPFADRAASIRARASGRAAEIDAARPVSTPGSWWTGSAIGTVEGFRQAWIGAKMYMADTLGLGDLQDDQQGEYQASLDRVSAATPRDMSRTGKAVYGGLQSLEQMVPTIGATLLTGPVGGLAVAGGQTGLQAYGKYRARGGTPDEALVGGGLEGAIEAGTEMLPLGVVAKRFGKSGTAKFLGEFLGKEMFGEQIATHSQDAVDTAIANPSATWEQYLKDRPEAAFDTAVAVAMGTGALGAVHHVVEHLAPVEQSLEQAAGGLASSSLVDNIMAQSDASKLRTRDPDAFRRFLDQQTSGSPVENVFVPAQKMRELMQSDAFDPRTWEDVAPDLDQQVGQALAINGDVVLPVSAVAAHLAGTPAWDALQGNARLSPGGMSENEAKAYLDDHADVMERLGGEARAAYEAEQEAREPERKVHDAVFEQLRQAGFNARSSGAYADLWASRYAARAERSGGDAYSAFQRSNVSIQQELPARIERYRKADELDRLINVMRRDRAQISDSHRYGPSLLEWLSARGGMEDRSGDLAALGAGEWHKGKPGKRKLVRPHDDEAQSSMLPSDSAGRSHAPDRTLEAAIEAGYFPQFSGLSNGSGTYADLPDVDVLYDAIDHELRGHPTYSADEERDQREAELRDGADDLRGFLEARGIDADQATRDEIEKAIAQDQRQPARALDQSARGRIDLHEDGQRVIRLFEGRDLSTTLHESSHLWLEELREDAEAEGASDRLKVDWQAVQDWFTSEGHAIGEDGVIPTEAHEMWARGMERYFMEGKAPSSSLQSAFAAFRAWLLRIYAVVQNLRAPITPEIRAVMDRMLATDEAISLATRETRAQPLFASAEQAGMTAAEFSAYQTTVQQARTEAIDALLFRTMEGVRRARTKEWKDDRATVREGVLRELRSQPEFKAIALLRAKGDDRIALDRQAVVDEYGEDALALVPKGVPPTVVSSGGVHPDILAERVGLSSGRDLMERLMGVQQRENELRASKDRRSALDEAADIEADRIMRERHGDPLADGSIEEEALGAIHSDQRATVLATELRALGRKIGTEPAPLEFARRWAERTVREGLVTTQASASALARHQRAEAKAGREAERAILAGDLEAAFRAKQQQMLNGELYRAAKRAKDDIDRMVKRLGKLAKAKSLPSMDQDYLDRIHDLLAVYDMRPRSVRAVTERESFAAWVKAKEEAGEEVHVPLRLRDAGATNFTKLTYDDLTALDDTVSSIAHLGRMKKKLLIANEQRDYDEAMEFWRVQAASLPSRGFSPDRNTPRSIPRTIIAGGIRVDNMAKFMDGDRPGLMTDVLVTGARDAQNTQARLTKQVMEPIARAYMDMPRPQRARLMARVTVPELLSIDPDSMSVQPTTFSRMDLLAVALNMGTESNLDKMIRGENTQFRLMPEHQWSEHKLQAVLARELQKEDWDLVQRLWLHVGSLWPEIVKAERSITGVAPEKVEGRKVQTPFGEIEGAYWPVVYDPAPERARWANFDATNHAADDAAKLFGQLGRGVATPKGHTVERTEYAAPMLLALEPVLFNHVRRVTTRAAYGAWARDALKVINDPHVRDLWNRKLGSEYHDQLMPWLRAQINGAALNTADIRGLDLILRKARTNATAVGLVFRFTTMISQAAGLTNSVAEIGPHALASGYASAFNFNGDAKREAFAKSEELSRRAGEYDRDVQAALQDMLNSPRTAVGRALKPATDFKARFNALGYHLIGTIQLHLVDVPTWLGAYGRGIQEAMTEHDAVAYADRSVARAQGASNPKDLASWQRASEGYKTLTTFYTFAGTVLNYQWEAAQDIRRGQYKAAGSKLWWVMMAGPLLTAVLTGDLPEEDESWFGWAMKTIFFGLWQGMPGVRELISPYDPKTPLTRAYQSVKGSAKDAFSAFAASPAYREAQSIIPGLPDGGEVSDRWVRHLIESAGYISGLGTGQLGTTADYAAGVATNEQQPSRPADVAKGIVKGRQAAQD